MSADKALIMSLEKINLCVFIGFKCCIKCRHCAVLNLTKRKLALDDKEITYLKKIIKNYNISDIVFSGGEPFLYAEKINKFNLKNSNLTIITNAFFAKNEIQCKKYLDKIKYLNKIVVSHDCFHEEYIPKSNIDNLITYCKNNNINVRGSITLATPFDLKYCNIFKKHKVRYKVGKLSYVGEAINLKNKYYNEKINQKNVSNKKCTMIKGLQYIPQRGFTFCCSNLLFGKNYEKFENIVYFEDIEKLHNSNIYKTLKRLSFKKMYENLKYKSNLFTSYCDICERYFYENYDEYKKYSA